MPSVAMKEFTRSFTTMNPDTKPTAAHATTAMIAFRACGLPVFCASAVVIAIEKPIIMPIDRSNVSATSGTRKANASSATIAFSVSTRLMLVQVRNCGWVRLNTIMKPAHRYNALYLSRPDFCTQVLDGGRKFEGVGFAANRIRCRGHVLEFSPVRSVIASCARSISTELMSSPSNSVTMWPLRITMTRVATRTSSSVSVDATSTAAPSFADRSISR